MPKKITKKEVEKLINDAPFLDEKDKAEWMKSIENFDEDELKKVYDFFTGEEQDEKRKIMKFFFDNNLEDEYFQELKNISNEFKGKAIEKEEQYLKTHDENPEDVLKKLNNI